MAADKGECYLRSKLLAIAVAGQKVRPAFVGTEH